MSYPPNQPGMDPVARAQWQAQQQQQRSQDPRSYGAYPGMQQRQYDEAQARLIAAQQQQQRMVVPPQGLVQRYSPQQQRAVPTQQSPYQQAYQQQRQAIPQRYPAAAHQQQQQRGPAQPPRGGPPPSSNKREPLPGLRDREREKDGAEDLYLDPSPSNRIILSLRSGIDEEVDWGLSRLLNATFHYPERIVVSEWFGLAEALLVFPRRIVDWLKSQREPASSTALITSAATTSNPLPALAMKRALHASLIFRNLSLQPINVERLLLTRGTLQFIADLLEAAPEDIGIRTYDEDQRALKDSPAHAPPDNKWGHLDGLEEMRNHWLDILEGLSSFLSLERSSELWFQGDGLRRNDEAVLIPGSAIRKEEEEGGDSAAPDPQNAPPKSAIPASLQPHFTKLAQSIFDRLLVIVHSTEDRALLLGALRCLSVLAARSENEPAFVERSRMIQEKTRVSSPGLVGRCVALLPLSADALLLEAATDCLYQLLLVGTNALLLGKQVLASDKEASTSCAADVLGSISLLVRNLHVEQATWTREHPLQFHLALHAGVPSRFWAKEMEAEKARLERAKASASSSNDPQAAMRNEKGREGRWLTRGEKERLLAVPEPQRLLDWMRTVYEASPDDEVTQMEIWTTYRDEFQPFAERGRGAPLQAAAEVIRQASIIFPKATAMVVPHQRFIIRGVALRDRRKARAFECKWKGCGDPHTESFDEVRKHVEVHVGGGGRCAWLECGFEGADGKALLKHVLTHLPEHKGGKKDVKSSAGASKSLAGRRPGEALSKDVVRILPSRGGSDVARVIGDGALKRDSSALDASSTDGEASSKRRPQHTVDNPGRLLFNVSRTPYGQGVALTSSLVLRLVARTAATVLARAEASGVNIGEAGDAAARSAQSTAARAAASAKKRGAAPSTGERDEELFGLPLPRYMLEDGGGAAGGFSAPWAVGAARGIMDALLTCEDDIVSVSAENDILCPTLADVMAEIRPLPVESLLPAELRSQEQPRQQPRDAVHPHFSYPRQQAMFM